MAKYLIKTIKIEDDAKSGDLSVESDWMYVDPETIHTIDIFGKKFKDKAKPIVHCRDCKHLNKEEMRCFEVEGLGYRNVSNNYFCSRGERREE